MAILIQRRSPRDERIATASGRNKLSPFFLHLQKGLRENLSYNSTSKVLRRQRDSSYIVVFAIIVLEKRKGRNLLQKHRSTTVVVSPLSLLHRYDVHDVKDVITYNNNNSFILLTKSCDERPLLVQFNLQYHKRLLCRLPS